MPEDFEAEPTEMLEEPTPESVEAGPEAQPETEPQGRQMSASELRIREIYQDLKTERDTNQQLQRQIMWMQQQLMAATQPQKQPPPAPKIDPEIDELINPSIASRLSPLEQRLARQEQINAALYAQQEAAAAWDYVKTAVPDMDELAPDIQAYLQSIPKGRADKITQDPDLVIQTAELVRAMRGAGKAVGVQAARQDLKQRSKSDVGAASPASISTKVDWNDPNLDWAAQEARLEAMRRGR